MTFDHDWDDPDCDDGDPGAGDFIDCPECRAEIDSDSEACPRCGYWITEADLDAAWRADSATGRVLRIGWWILGLALVGALIAPLGMSRRLPRPSHSAPITIWPTWSVV